MKHVAVLVMGGAVFVYEEGSTFMTSDRWLHVKDRNGDGLAAFTEHRVVRAFYVDNPANVEQAHGQLREIK